MIINSEEIKKEIFLNVVLAGRHISSYAGIEELTYRPESNLIILKIKDRLQFIHYIAELTEEINTEDYINYIATMEV